MKGLKFSKQTGIISLAFFIAYVFYGIFRIPFTQFLVSMAVGGIAYGISDSYEIALIGLLAMNFLFPFFAGSITRKEGFMNSKPEEVSKRVVAMMRAPSGVGSQMSEGFEDASEMDMTISKNSSTKNTESVTATSVPAPVEEKGSEAKGPEAKGPEAKGPEAKGPEAKGPETKETFKSNGLFKLGEIPEDVKGGFHIDAGTTVMNALNSLKPDQISAMTKDTKQLIDTQKSLMNLLQTFTPMVTEGKQMMDTFNTMFSPAMGAMKTTQGMLSQ